MARPKKQFPPKKEHRITIRMTEDMYFVVAREAERAGLSISDYFRQLVLHHKIVYKPPIIHDDRAIIEELKDINKLGNNLNQIARHLNQGRNNDRWYGERITGSAPAHNRKLHQNQ